MKSKEPKTMAEIHKIREKIYLLTKGMTIHEKMEFIGKKAKAFEAKHNLNLKLKTIEKIKVASL